MVYDLYRASGIIQNTKQGTPGAFRRARQHPAEASKRGVVLIFMLYHMRQESTMQEF
jgi:hypothetical protein